MFRVNRDIQRHAGEFLRALNNHQYEVGAAGLLFPKQRVFIGGVFTTRINGRDPQMDPNLIPTQGLNHILNSVLNGDTQITQWYMALYTNNVSPQLTTTALNFASTMTEFDGYAESERPAFTPDAASTTAAIGNDGSRAEFTINATATLRGGAILSSDVIGGTSGTMFACTAFATARGVVSGDSFEGVYEVTATNEA